MSFVLGVVLQVLGDVITYDPISISVLVRSYDHTHRFYVNLLKFSHFVAALGF